MREWAKIAALVVWVVFLGLIALDTFGVDQALAVIGMGH